MSKDELIDVLCVEFQKSFYDSLEVIRDGKGRVNFNLLSEERFVFNFSQSLESNLIKNRVGKIINQMYEENIVVSEHKRLNWDKEFISLFMDKLKHDGAVGNLGKYSMDTFSKFVKEFVADLLKND